jgi:prevent-host-death family protein
MKIKSLQEEPHPLLSSRRAEGSVNVRLAKAQLSALLDRVEKGEEITLTRDGDAVATLVPARRKRQVFVVDPELKALRASMTMQTEGPFSTELVRQDRDGRGW